MRGLDIQNESKTYLDEKELYILYQLRRNKRISTFGCSAFRPKDQYTFHIPDNTDTLTEELEKFQTRAFDSVRRKSQSPTILSYLLDLGGTLDTKGFSIEVEVADPLQEGGFLCEWDGHKHYPAKVYQSAILDKEAEPDFIELVNKLITENDGGKWDTTDAQKFLDIYYQHNRVKKPPFVDDSQTKLSKLIFEHADFILVLKNTDKLDAYLADYIGLFVSDKLDGISKGGLTGHFFSDGQTATTPLHRQFFGYKKQRDLLIECLTEKHNEYQREELEISNPYFEPKYVGNLKGEVIKLAIDNEDSKTADLFLFVHSMIALEKEDYLEINQFYYRTTEMFDMYDRGFVFKVELNPKIVTADEAIAGATVGAIEKIDPTDGMQITLGVMDYRKAKYGFIQLFKRSKKISLGKLNTRQYRLVRCLFSPENTPIDASYNPIFQVIHRVYENISLPKDKVNGGLKNNSQIEKQTIIEHVIKEIQKIKGLQGYIDFAWSPDRDMVRMNLHPRRGAKL